MAWPYPRIIAHRGGGSLAPENTLAAMKKSVALGFHGVEFDVKLANDATPVLFHDDTLERTSSGKGLLRNFSYAELAKLDAGSWFAAEFAGETIPLFEPVAAFLIGHGVWANVEIKPCQGRDDITGETVALAARELWKGVAQQPVLSSFSIAALRAAKAAAPELPRGYVVREVPGDWIETMQELGCVSLHCRYRTLTRDLAKAVRDAGYGLLVWTVNDPDAAREALSWGANAIVTDRLDLIAPDFQ
jgi:glycerophosphoryl diester phosphodiesterase